MIKCEETRVGCLCVSYFKQYEPERRSKSVRDCHIYQISMSLLYGGLRYFHFHESVESGLGASIV